MKYADGPSASVEVSIAAPVTAVWALVTDVDLPSRFSEEFQGAEWSSDERGLGATFEGHNKHPSVGEWTTTSTIVAFDEGSAFGWAVGDPSEKVAMWRFDLEEVGAETRLRFSAEMGPGRSGLNSAIDAMPDREDDIVARRLDQWNDNMARTIEGIKELAEKG